MLNLARRNAFYILFLFVIAVLYLPKMFFADSAFYASSWVEKTLTYVGPLSRLLFLLVGFLLARRTAAVFEKDNPVEPAWGLLAWGLLCYFLGQSVLGIYQLVLLVDPPYPSLGDFFFLLAMLLWLVSLVTFVRAYTQAGFMAGSAKRVAVVISVAVLVLVALGLAVLKPLLEAPAPLAEKALNVIYPVFDLLLLIPVLVLLQMALKLRGKLSSVWMALLVGFNCLAMADILFAFFTTMDMAALDPLLDVLFTYSYIFIAWGVSLQYSLLKD
jgi:hypothetical protein